MTDTIIPVANDNDRKTLEELLIDNQDFERLESLLSPFNIFEALGAVHQEIRHSDFLAYLLDPQQNHGLGDFFLKRLLQTALRSNNTETPVTPIDIDLWNLDTAVVAREWENIDILITDEQVDHKLAVIIENKIGSAEHDDQLARYYTEVRKHYPAHQIVALFLTPDGDQPSHQQYIPIDYTTIAQLTKGIADSHSSVLGADVLTIITHYEQMLRRHIVSDSEIAQLCQRIYKKHQRALDLIFEHRPDTVGKIKDIIDQFIRESSEMVPIYSTKSYINFTLAEWKVRELMDKSTTEEGIPILQFAFESWQDGLRFKLLICPGPVETRQRLLDMALRTKGPFKCSYKSLYRKWNSIYSVPFLTAKSYEKDIEEIAVEIRGHLDHFIKNDLPEIKKAVTAEISSIDSQ